MENVSGNSFISNSTVIVRESLFKDRNISLILKLKLWLKRTEITKSWKSQSHNDQNKCFRCLRWRLDLALRPFCLVPFCAVCLVCDFSLIIHICFGNPIERLIDWPNWTSTDPFEFWEDDRFGLNYRWKLWLVIKWYLANLSVYQLNLRCINILSIRSIREKVDRVIKQDHFHGRECFSITS
jgi:hypothetical protein